MTKSNSDTSFTTDVARFYESTLVPLIFETYASDLADRVKAVNPDAVLEVACGTGVVTRSLADVLPPSCEIVATDLNEAMVSHGESIGTARPVKWKQADVMTLPFPDESFDVVVCQFAVMFFPDPVAAYQEVLRVLRPGGTFLFSIWNGLEKNDFARVITEAVAALYPENPPVFLARTPHGHGDPEEIKSHVSDAGFESCLLTQRDDVSTAAAPDLPAIAYCQGTPLRNEIEKREPGGLGRVTALAEQALRTQYGDGPIEGQISAVIVSAK